MDNGFFMSARELMQADFPAKVRRDGMFIVIIDYDYDIPLSDFKTETDLLKWVSHLSEKSWDGIGEIIYQVISIVCSVKQWKLW